MDFTCEERPSDSPFVEVVWRSQSEEAGAFTSMAESHCSLVVTKYQGKTSVTVRGPEIRATPAYGPSGAEFFGIILRSGAFMPDLPAKMVMDRHDVNLPEAASNSFWLKGSAWQFPEFENVDTFVNRLIREGLLVYEPIVGAVLQGQPINDITPRSVQRRFSQATGLTQSYMRQIDRARYAAMLLKQGVSILDTVYQAGYFDQPHLTRSLKHFIGFTPAQLISQERKKPLSFLYKTVPLLLDYDVSIR